MDGGLVEAGCVVLYADGLLALIQFEVANAVDLAYPRQGKGGGLGRGDSVAVENVELCHALDHISGLRARGSVKSRVWRSLWLRGLSLG